MDLSLETRQEGNRTIIEVDGEIDVYTAPKLRECISGLVDDGQSKLVIDLEQVQFMDSTGLGMLVDGLKRVHTIEGTLELVCTHERVLRTLRITGLNKVFLIHGSQSEALAAK